jgi:hypothetical protein
MFGMIQIAMPQRPAAAMPLMAFMLLVLGGCQNLGPRAIEASRTDYNTAILETDDEQLLLNLVRLRYRDRLMFLEAASVTTQFSFGASAGAAYGYQSLARENSVIDGRVLIEERPTVTYQPLQGKEFVEKVLSRIPLKTLVLLDGSGWSSERVFRVCVERMNDLRNATSADGPTPTRAPQFEEFERAAFLLQELRDLDMFAGARTPGEERSVIRFRPEATELDQYKEWVGLLDLDSNRQVFSLENSLDRSDGRTLNIRTRSFQGVMYFLSHGVEVPEVDVAAGRVTVTVDDDGQPFDWRRVTGGLMRIRSSSERPENAAVTVAYRGHWFFIDDTDLDSKSTFSMLGQIYALQSSDVSTAAPMLTLPVGD